MKLLGTVDEADRFLTASYSLPSKHDHPTTKEIGAAESRYSNNVRFMHYVGGLLC